MTPTHRRYRELLHREARTTGYYFGDALDSDNEHHSVSTQLAHNPLLFYGIDVYDLMKGPPGWVRMRLLHRWLHRALVPGTEVDRTDDNPFDYTCNFRFARDGKTLEVKVPHEVVEDELDTGIIDRIYNTVFDLPDDERAHWFMEYVG